MDASHVTTVNVCQMMYVELRKFTDMNARTAEIRSFCMYKIEEH